MKAQHHHRTPEPPRTRGACPFLAVCLAAAVAFGAIACSDHSGGGSRAAAPVPSPSPSPSPASPPRDRSTPPPRSSVGLPAPEAPAPAVPSAAETFSRHAPESAESAPTF